MQASHRQRLWGWGERLRRQSSLFEARRVVWGGLDRLGVGVSRKGAVKVTRENDTILSPLSKNPTPPFVTLFYPSSSSLSVRRNS